jgi:hypothetical protein
MKNQRETSLRIRLGGIAIPGLFITLAAARLISAGASKASSELIVTGAVPGMIAAHDMRMARVKTDARRCFCLSSPICLRKSARIYNHFLNIQLTLGNHLAERHAIPAR